jgi:hypothetical protein
VVLAATYTDPQRARQTLTELVDAGYEGSLLSSGDAGRVRFELRVGPYRSVEEAERAAETLRRAYALSPQVLVERNGAGP